MPLARPPCLLVCVLLVGVVSCKEKPAPRPEEPGVAAYLMPPGRARFELHMERRVSGPGRDPLRQPRLVVAKRARDGIVYTIREQIDQRSWRTTAKLFFTVTGQGAFLARQEDLTGQPVGTRERRLVLPWPIREGDERALGYHMLGRTEDGATTARARVSVLRAGFGETVVGKSYSPCVEVRELLLPDAGGRLDIRSVYCRGLGRARIEQRNETLSRGESLVVDRVVGVREVEKP